MSLTSIKGEQFMSRSGSFSTHGSRRGFSDLGQAVGSEAFNSPLEEKAEVSRMIAEVSLIKSKTEGDLVRLAYLQARSAALKHEIAEFHYNREKIRNMNFCAHLKAVCREKLSESDYMSIVTEAGRRTDEQF